VAKRASILATFAKKSQDGGPFIFFEDGQFFDGWMRIFKNWPVLARKKRGIFKLFEIRKVEKYWVVIQIRDTKYCKLGAQERAIFKLLGKHKKASDLGKSKKGPP